MSKGGTLRVSCANAKRVVRIALYARYSSENQNPRSTKEQISTQLDKLGKKQIPFVKFSYSDCEFLVEEEHIYQDEAVSGRLVSRDGLDRLKRDARAGKFNAILVDDLSRIVRDLGAQTDFYKLLKFLDIELYSIGDHISSASPSSKMHFQMRGMLNEITNEIHAHRTRRGQEARVLDGYSAGDVCYGYRTEPTQTRMVGVNEVKSHFKTRINPEEAAVINLIFDFKIKGLGYSAIARELNRRKIPSTSRGQKITGREVNWSSSIVRKILTREKYIGIRIWGKTSRILNPDTEKFVKKAVPKDRWLSSDQQGEIDPDLVIVSMAKWKTVQSMIASSTALYKERHDKLNAARTVKQVGSKSRTLLAGILLCGECGSLMLQVTGQKGGFYGCYQHHRKDKIACANNRLLSRKKSEAKVVSLLKNLFCDSAYLEAATKRANEIIKERLRAVPEEIRALEVRRRDAEREVQNLLKFVTAHGDTSASVRDSLAAKEQELEVAVNQLRVLKSADVDRLLLTPFALRERFARLGEYLERDLVIANAHLKQLFPSGLRCVANRATQKKNHNQRNSLWLLEGVMLVSNELLCPGFQKCPGNIPTTDSLVSIKI